MAAIRRILYPLEVLKTFWSTTSKEVRLNVEAVYRDDQKVELKGKTLAACRIFPYGSLPTIGAGRALTHAITEHHKNDPKNTISAFDDPFLPGAVRHALMRHHFPPKTNILGYTPGQVNITMENGPIY
jgi:hypothetical protein